VGVCGWLCVCVCVCVCVCGWVDVCVLRIYGPKYEDGERKSRTNRELEELSKGEYIVKWIKGQR
jgi:hypothetical protein